ncbi:MAG: long-chain fatty acid--CoA ligase, partial [Alphaproteobacteria bacterium]
ERPLFAILDDAVARFGDRPCVDFLGKRFSYREIGDLVARAARGLQAHGVGKGSRVGLLLPNTPYYVIFYFAVMKCGATVVNFNPLYAEREIAHQIEDSETDIMVTLDLRVLHDKARRMLTDTRLKRLVICRFADILPFPKNWLFTLARRKALARIPDDDRHLRFDDLVANDGRFATVAVVPGDLAVLQYTGGTTGVPKGAMLTHGNLYANVTQAALWFPDAKPGAERMLGVLPFFHVFAMTVVMNFSIYYAWEIIMLPRFDVDDVLKAIDRKTPTAFPAVPTIYTAIITHPRRAKYDLKSIRYCLSGGAALPVDVKQTFEAVTGCRLVEGYGLSESSPIATANPLDGVNKAGSIGLPVPRTTIEIVALEDRDKVLPLGERGEVCIRGPQVMMGYWNKPDETADTLVDGRLHTGDVGYMDDDGYVFIVDRINDLILAGGYNIYPRNVEEAIYLHPAVDECIVAGVPDDYRGQTVKAYIKLAADHDLTQDDLTAFLKDKLSPIEMPKLVEFRDELPKTMIGKLSRKAVLDEEAAKADSDQK